MASLTSSPPVSVYLATLRQYHFPNLSSPSPDQNYLIQKRRVDLQVLRDNVETEKMSVYAWENTKIKHGLKSKLGGRLKFQYRFKKFFKIYRGISKYR